VRRTFNRLLIFLPLLALIETSTAQAADPRQVIVVKVSPETDARIIHRAGDPVALLEIDHAPDNIVEVLTHQLGDWCSKIERRGIYGHTVTFALFLRDASVFPTVGWGKKPRSLRLQFTPRPKAMRPKATEVVGRMAGFGSSVEHRYLLPPKPRRHPCKKPVFEDHCAHYKRALEAAQFLEEGKPVDTFERWAFRFRFEKPWTRNLPAYAYTGIVVARLLVHRDLAPEAEAFLRSDPVFAVERHIPYTALILAGIYEKTDRRDEAVEILTEMMKTTKERELRGHATLALLELQIHGRRFVEAAQLAEELTADRAGDGDVAAKSWMLSGEVKIAMGAFDAAETCFRNAMKTVRDRQLEADIHLRLGDLALQNHRARSVARRQYERASKGDECTVKRVELRRMLRFGPFAKYATLEDRVAQLVEFGACPAVRFEATYALAFVHSALGNDLEALQTLIAAKEMKSDFVQAWAVDVAYLSATQQVVGRWIERLARAEAWPEIIGLMEGPVGEVRGSLDAPTLVAISRAHRMMNVDGGFWDDLLVQLRRGLDEEVEREALIELIESYLVAEDTFRADVAIGYFIEQHDDSIDGWRGRHLAARRALLGQRADVALAHLDAVESLTPPGDPLQEAKALRTRALLGAGRTSDAASSLLAWLDGTPTPTQGVGALTVDVTSACLRECNDEQVAQLLKRINTFEDGALVTDRIRVLAKQRGVELRDKAAQEGKGSVWKRYGEVIAASEDLEEIKE
jgi:tetratricopeptide (TPR) repeat protein